MGDLTIRPANEATPGDIQVVFGTRGSACDCQCQRYKLARGEAFGKFPVEERRRRLEEQTGAGDPGAEATSGLLAYLDREPVGWCAVEPRANYHGMARNQKVPWAGRTEDKSDPNIWAITCVFTRTGFRGTGIAHALVAAAVEHARAGGAAAVEAYPIVTTPGARITWDEIHPGTPQMYAAAGLVEVAHPFPRRLVMRRDFP